MTHYFKLTLFIYFLSIFNVIASSHSSYNEAVIVSPDRKRYSFNPYHSPHAQRAREDLQSPYESHSFNEFFSSLKEKMRRLGTQRLRPPYLLADYKDTINEINDYINTHCFLSIFQTNTLYYIQSYAFIGLSNIYGILKRNGDKFSYARSALNILVKIRNRGFQFLPDTPAEINYRAGTCFLLMSYALFYASQDEVKNKETMREEICVVSREIFDEQTYNEVKNRFGRSVLGDIKDACRRKVSLFMEA